LDAGCSPLLWTYQRYGPDVIAAMMEALTSFMREYRYTGLVLIGHSGGGALALLLAQHFAATREVVTLAGNADIDVWADLHGFTRLQGSLNPASVPGGEFAEMHLLGGRDEVIPAAVFQPVLRKRQNAQIAIIPGFDHVCCWEKLWPDILNNLP
jgi:pimeloyl-ACP methyl ester carboxylesterase